MQKEEEAKRLARDIESLQVENQRLTSQTSNRKQDIDNIRSTSESRSDEFNKMKKKLDEETVKKQQVRCDVRPNMYVCFVVILTRLLCVAGC